MAYQLLTLPRAKRELRRLSAADFQRIDAAIQSLKDNPRPRGVRKLTGPIHRLRVGPWRVIYAIYDREQRVVVGKVARRAEDTYDDVEELL